MPAPEYYPPASRTQWCYSAFRDASFAVPVRKVLWHTTEGTGWPAYSGGAMAPHFTVMPDFGAQKMVWRQHFPLNVYSRGLVNEPGGVETNTDGVIQVEIVGTCDPATHAKWAAPHLYSPELTDWQIAGLAAFATWMHAEYDIPYRAPTFMAYPASFGHSSVRMSGQQWLNFAGHLGHQHAPENDHGDPGALPIAAIFSAAQGEDDMQLNDTVTLTAAQAKAMSLNGTPRQAGDRVSVTYLLMWGGAGGERDYASDRAIASSLATLAAQVSTIATVVTTQGGITQEQLEAAAQAGATAALAELGQVLVNAPAAGLEQAEYDELARLDATESGEQ